MSRRKKYVSPYLSEDDAPLAREAGRKRDHWFAEEIIEAMMERDETKPSDESKQVAVNNVYCYGRYGGTWPKKTALAKARQVLRRPIVRDAIAAAFANATGFDLVEAMNLHVAHIRGEVPAKRVVTIEDGVETEVVEMAPPSYQALKDYEGLVFPKETRVQHHRNENINVTVAGPPVRVGAPVMRARVINASSVAALPPNFKESDPE